MMTLAKALKSKPSPIYHQKFANRITTGNLEDDIAQSKRCRLDYGSGC